MPEAAAIDIVATRAADLWFDDGNVVLVAEETGFKVYKGILCREARVFEDMFSMPASDAQATYEGVLPLIKVQESVQDFTSFLSALFNP